MDAVEGVVVARGLELRHCLGNHRFELGSGALWLEVELDHAAFEPSGQLADPIALARSTLCSRDQGAVALLESAAEEDRVCQIDFQQHVHVALRDERERAPEEMRSAHEILPRESTPPVAQTLIRSAPYFTISRVF